MIDHIQLEMENDQTNNTLYKINENALIRHKNSEYKFKDLVKHYLIQFQNINHQIYRKVVKKVRRKYYRQQIAESRETVKKKYPRVDSRPFVEIKEIILSNEPDLDKSIKEREHQLWLEREKLAQIEWNAKKEKALRDRCRAKYKEEKETKKNYEIEQKVQIVITLSLKTHQVQYANKEVEQKGNNSTHNPFLTIQSQHPLEAEDLREKCNFFLKTGVCKYGNLCTRSHVINNLIEPSMNTLIFPGMYMNMLLGYELLNLDIDSDQALEYEESDIIEHYNQFYDDVVNEMKIFGKLCQFLVCSNYEPHLRGNVYVQFENDEDAVKAYYKLNGRFYGGKKIYCYFSHVKNWKDAVCGYFLRKKCPQGNKCNYLHVFKNPNNEFSINNFSFTRKRHLTHKTSKMELLLNSNNLNDKNNAWSSDDDDTIKTQNENILIQHNTSKTRREFNHSKEHSDKRKIASLKHSHKHKEGQVHTSRNKRSKHRSKSPRPKSNNHKYHHYEHHHRHVSK